MSIAIKLCSFAENQRNLQSKKSTSVMQQQSDISFKGLYSKGASGFYGLNHVKPVSKISFGYYDYGKNDRDPVRKLLRITKGFESVDPGQWWQVMGTDDRKWVSPNHPRDLLVNRELSSAIDSIATIAGTGKFIPANFEIDKTKIYGDDWGKRATYIEMNPRMFGKMEHGHCSEGILGAMRILPAIPASRPGHAHCVVLSQLYPSWFSDDRIAEDNSLYRTNIGAHNGNNGISRALATKIVGENETMQPEEVVKSFNDLAHMRGLKTGIRMNLSSEELQYNGGHFSWDNKLHRTAYLSACRDAIDMGFDCIFFNTARHIGGREPENITGGLSPGSFPKEKHIAEIFHKLKADTRGDISLVGEYTDDFSYNGHFPGLGFTTGCGGNAVVVSTDNGNQGGYEERQAKIQRGLFSDGPMFMQLDDIMPYSKDIHTLMEHNRASGWNPNDHWWHVFKDDHAANEHRRIVMDKFMQ